MTPFLTGLIIGVFAGCIVGWLGLSIVACGGRSDLETENARLKTWLIKHGYEEGEL